MYIQEKLQSNSSHPVKITNSEKIQEDYKFTLNVILGTDSQYIHTHIHITHIHTYI